MYASILSAYFAVQSRDCRHVPTDWNAVVIESEDNHSAAGVGNCEDVLKQFTPITAGGLVKGLLELDGSSLGGGVERLGYPCVHVRAMSLITFTFLRLSGERRGLANGLKKLLLFLKNLTVM